MKSMLLRWTWRRTLYLSLFICLLCGSILVAPLLILDDGPRRADAIVVIGGDHKPDRVKRAAELYQQGYASVVVVSAGTEVREGGELLPEAEVMRRQLLALGLPENILLVEDESQSTFQNAYYTRSICEERGFRSILLVSSAFHSRRARRIYQDVFGSDVEVWIQPAPRTSCASCWWPQPDEFTVVLYEYYNWGRYWLGLRSPREMPPAGSDMSRVGG